MNDLKLTKQEAIILYTMAMGDRAAGKENNTSYFIMAWLEKILGLKDGIDTVNALIEGSHK